MSFEKPWWWNNKVAFDPNTGMAQGYTGPANPTGATPLQLKPGEQWDAKNNRVIPAPRSYGGLTADWKPTYQTPAGTDFYGHTMPGVGNPEYYATPETAAVLADALGGTVVSMATPNIGQTINGQPAQETMIQLPDGTLMNAGQLAGLWERNAPTSTDVAWKMLQQYVQAAQKLPDKTRQQEWIQHSGGLQPVNVPTQEGGSQQGGGNPQDRLAQLNNYARLLSFANRQPLQAAYGLPLLGQGQGRPADQPLAVNQLGGGQMRQTQQNAIPSNPISGLMNWYRAPSLNNPWRGF